MSGDLDAWWRVALAVLGPLSRAAFRLRVLDPWRVPARGAAVIAGNHVSALDGVLLGIVTARRGRRVRFLTAAEFFARPLHGFFLRRLGQIPIRRGAQDQAAVEEAVATVRGGALAGIFVEGTVNPKPEAGLLPGRTGVARLALGAGAPVVPVGIWGPQWRWPRRGPRFAGPLRPPVTVAFGEPLDPRGDPSSAADLEAFRDLVMAAVEREVWRARTDAAARLGLRSGTPLS